MATADAAPTYPESPILVVDDDETLRTRIELLFARAGLDNVVATGDQGLASAMVAEGRAGLVLLDLFLPEEAGESLLREFSVVAPEVPVIVLTSSAETATVVRCMRAGAVDYLVKPIDETRLFVSVWNALASIELRAEARDFRDRVLAGKLEKPEAFERIVTRDERMLALFKYVESVARSRQPVLITGETGTGKELFARAVHEASGRKGPFVAVNVGGLDDTMFSDSLFGHRKGAYTGADAPEAGPAQGGRRRHHPPRRDRRPRDPLADQAPPAPPGGRVLSLGSRTAPCAPTPAWWRPPRRTSSPPRPRVLSAATSSIDCRPTPSRSRPCARGPATCPSWPAAFSSTRPGTWARPSLTRRRSRPAPKGGLARSGSTPSPATCASCSPSSTTPSPRPAAASSTWTPYGPGSAWSPSGEPKRAEPQRSSITAPSLSAEGTGLPPLAQILAEGRIPTLEDAERELVRMAVASASGNLSQAASILGISRQTLYNKLKE